MKITEKSPSPSNPSAPGTTSTSVGSGSGNVATTASAASPSTTPVVTQAIVPPPLQLLDLPVEIISHIGTMLDTRSTLAFSETSGSARDTYSTEDKAWLTMAKRCLSLIDKQPLTEAEKTYLQKTYHLILSWLFEDDIGGIELTRNTALAEEFSRHLTKSEIKNILLDVLSRNPKNLQNKFEKLATINLPFTTSLITALSAEEITLYFSRISDNFLIDKLSSNVTQVENFLATLQESSYNSALHYAIEGQYFDIARALLEAHPQSVDIRDNAGATALILALNQHVESNSTLPIIHLLLNHNASVNVTDDLGHTPLIQAISKDHIDIVFELLKREADVNAQNHEGYTALMFALDDKPIEIIQALLAQNADVNLQDEEGNTALMKALMAEMLLDIPDDNSNDEFSITALPRGYDVVTDTVDYSESLAIAKLLLDAGASITLTNLEGHSALSIAQQSGNEAFKTLIESYLPS
jgi:ankyrin repeat protein